MASTYSNLKIQLMATGENSGTWGNVTNANLGDAIEQALVETATVTFASANVTLTLSDSNSKQDARALRLNLTGTTAGARDLIVPAIQKPYLVNNGTADTVTVKVSGQTGIAVPAGASMLLYNNGTDVIVAFNRVVGNVTGNVTGTASNATVLQTARTIAISGNVTGTATSFDGSGNISIPVTAINVDAASAGTLAVNRGGTGATSLTADNVILGNGTSAVKFVAAGTTGNVLTSNGTAWVSQAISAGGNFVQQIYTSPTTWTKPTGLKAIRVYLGAGGGGGGPTGPGIANVTKVGGTGGNGGTAFKFIAAPSIPGPVSVTVGAGGPGGSTGGTSSFGAFLSATGGTAGGGTVSPPNTNEPSRPSGSVGAGTGSDIAALQNSGGAGTFADLVGFGHIGQSRPAAGSDGNGPNATPFMAGGGGARTFTDSPLGTPGKTGGTGSAGIVLVEEYY